MYLVSNTPSGLVVKIGQQSYQEPEDTRILQVEGPVLFRYAFCQPVRIDRAKGWDLGREPIARWIVHGLPHGKLLLVKQVRRALTDTRLERWREVVLKVSGDHSYCAPEWVDCADDAGRWMSSLSEPMTASELVQLVDGYISDPIRVHSSHDELVLPYLIRKALVEHGHPVPGIDRITGLE